MVQCSLVLARQGSTHIRFSLIEEALRDVCSAKAPAARADFPAVVLQVAADAFQMQLSGLLILLASAKVHGALL